MDFHKNKKLIGLLFVLALLAGWLFSQKVLAPLPLPAATLKINNSVIKVEIATRPQTQYQGLSGRKSLEANAGMLFDYTDKQIREFVMRNMNFPLDIIFIADGKIINIAANLTPEGAQPKEIYRSAQPVNQVLEVNGGYCEKNGIKVGDQVLINQAL
ncbi:MAG: DUF192 domain-containing protein [Patescibacteria group bacterium]|jgi:hypothetical protein